MVIRFLFGEKLVKLLFSLVVCVGSGWKSVGAVVRGILRREGAGFVIIE